MYMYTMHIFLFSCSDYAAQPYELLQVPIKSRTNSITPTLEVTADPDKGTISTAPSNNISGEMCKLTVEESSSQLSANSRSSLDAQDSSSTNMLHAKSLGSLGVPSLPQKSKPELSSQETRSLVLSNKSQDSALKVDDFLSSLVTPHHSHTKEGQGIFQDLYLPPLPAPDMSQIFVASKTPAPGSVNSLNNSILSSRVGTLGSVIEEESTASSGDNKSSEVTLSVSEFTARQKPLDSAGHQLTTSNSRKKLVGQDSLTKMKRSNSKAMDLSKDKLLQATREKYCPTGMYKHYFLRLIHNKTLHNGLPSC